jgi:hypothetical protein
VTNTPAPIWRKSTYSNASGDCVEVATNLVDATGEVLVRDSKDPDGGPQRYTRSEWQAFLNGARDGEFNL